MKTGIETGAYFGDRLTDEGLAQAKAHGYDCLDYQFLADTNWEGYALQGQTFDAFFREEAPGKGELYTRGGLCYTVL